MAFGEPLYSYKETRMNFEPSSSAFTVDIKLPSSQPGSQRNSNRSSRSDTFRARNCATESSVYHRVHHQYPKSFLWRVLDDSRILSLRTVDVYKPKKTPDTNLVLNFHFPHSIKPNCIALADPPDHDALVVYAIDSAQQLYTLFLRPDSFRKRSFAEGGLGDSCKVHVSRTFGFRHPYRLCAIDSDQLVVSLYDGGHIRFERNKSTTGTQAPWEEKLYNAQGWVSVFINNTIRSGKDKPDDTAAAAAIQTNLGLNDASFLFTVCLDHRLRIWNLKSGQVLGAMDLLNAENRDPRETGKWNLDASQSNLIRIVGATEGKRLCVTYSPIGSGEFKFWRLQSDDGTSVDVNDLYPEARLIPAPPLGSDVWTMADFSVTERQSARGLIMWILWKNNMAYRVQELSFLADELEDVWQNGWRSVLSESTIPTAPTSGFSDSTDTAERWLQLILSPSRFPKSTVEAALGAYERAIGKTVEKTSRGSIGLAESICTAIASSSSLNKTSSGEINYAQFRSSSESQWRKFYRILLELDKPRGEALALAYESDQGMPWVVCADNISAIRRCNKLEEIYYNPQTKPEEENDLSALISTGRSFIDGFSDSMLQICRAVLRSELFEETSKTDPERIQFFSDKAGFWRQISDEDCAQVTDILRPNFNVVSNALYEGILTACNQTWDSQHHTEHPLTEFGRKVIVKATKDMAELQWNVCFSQLVLLVHMEFEFDRPEDALHNWIDIGTVYRSLIRSLKRIELIRWLGNTQLSSPLPKTDRSKSAPGSSPVTSKRLAEEHKVITALEGNIGHLMCFPEARSTSSESMSSIITKMVADLCAPDSDTELQPQYLQCALLVRDRADLAGELGPFCDEDPFSTYVQGRVYLALNDFTNAATYFKKAAYGMSSSQCDPHRHSSGLLDDTEWNLLYAGLPRYYAHIVALYEKPKAHSFVVEFAQLSLQFTNSKTIDADMVRTEVQSRLFGGAIAISRFELAHSTLIGMKDRTLQHSCLRALIQKMCDNLHNSELVELSFPGLQNAVDEILAHKCQDTMDVVTGVPYHQILYSWRIKRNDYRGAAAILLDRIQKLKRLGQGDQFTGDDVLDTVITRQYLMLINVLSCVEKKQAWITIEGLSSRINGVEDGDGKRRVVTLADIRQEYQGELDRIAAIENNQFGFAADDDMEIL
ncbi:nucleoporin Nup120/160-domain-containing protein [Xylariaceae sp. FL0016]|nr:nucleoporin Nup120/160-domain-containing protein [Xylariaceae sp. FL0016]